MDAEKKMVAIFLKLCHSFMKEVGMPSEALELLIRVTSTTTTGDLQAFQPLLFWKYVYASFCALEQKIAMGPFKKPQIPDLNFPAPREDEAGPSQMSTTMQKMTMAPLKKPQIPDLNLPAPREDEAGSSQMFTMRDPDAKFVEVEATIAAAVTTKRKTVNQAYQSGGKRFKVSEGPANFSKGKGIIVIED